MRIGLIYHRYPLYNKGSYVQEFVDSLCSNSDQVCLIAGQHPKSAFNKPDNLSITWVSLVNIPILGDVIFNFSVFFACFSAKFRDSDIINVLSGRGAPAALLFGKLTRKPVVITLEILNDPQNSFFDRLLYLLQRFTFQLPFDHIISWSSYYKNILLKFGVDATKISVLPSGINTTKYSPRTNKSRIRNNFPPRSILIVFAKPMYAYNRKMAELLLESVNLLKNKIDIRLLIGKGEQEELVKSKAENLGLSNKVSFMPVVSIDEIPEYLAASDIIVLPYNYSATTSRSLLEAMSMGKPIITTSVGEIENIVTDGTNALVVTPNPHQISLAIIKLISDKNLSSRLGKNARNLVKEKYSIEKITSTTIKIYSKLL